MNSEIKNQDNSSTLKFSIDRFEENFAVLENCQTGEIINISITELPENAIVGSILKFENGKYILDLEETKREQEIVKNMVANLFKKKD